MTDRDLSGDTPELELSADTPEVELSTLTPEVDPSTDSPDVQPSALTPQVEPSTDTPDVQPSALTPEVEPSTDTPEVQPSTDTPDVQPSALTPEVEPSTDTPDVQPSAAPDVEHETVAATPRDLAAGPAPTHAPAGEPRPTELPPAPPVAEASAHPDRWGRVDPDGTVYVRTADGERPVGSWQAGEPSEGLAHYARRFDDVRTEVELLEARLTNGSGDPKHTLTSARHIRDGLAEAAVVGDILGLTARLDHVLARAELAVEAAKHARDEARAQVVARKQELVAEAEKIAEESTQWKSAGDRLRAILDEWKTIKGVDRKTDDALWKRFSRARDTFNRRRGSHFADLDRQRATAKERKQELVDEAEQLAESDDWGPTAGRYKQLMSEWKAAGRAPKDADDALWQRFRAAQDKFFSRRSAVFNERDAELVANARKKEDLLAEAEKINPAADLDAARAQLHRIQERWENAGKVPRERIRELEGKLRAVEERVRSAADAQWRKADPETEARVAQFRERVEQFEAQAAKARSAGDTRRAEEAEAQAAQWREWLTAAENAVASR